MILGTLATAHRIASLHPGFAQAFSYIAQHDLLHAPLTRITLAGDKLFINNAASEAVEQTSQKLEVHRKYIDIHVLLAGQERIGWKDLNTMGTPIAPFDEDNDFALYEEEPTSFVDLLPGQFLIVYPEDAHAPLIGQGTIRKLVVKVAIDA